MLQLLQHTFSSVYSTFIHSLIYYLLLSYLPTTIFFIYWTCYLPLPRVLSRRLYFIPFLPFLPTAIYTPNNSFVIFLRRVLLRFRALLVLLLPCCRYLRTCTYAPVAPPTCRAFAYHYYLMPDGVDATVRCCSNVLLDLP